MICSFCMTDFNYHETSIIMKCPNETHYSLHKCKIYSTKYWEDVVSFIECRFIWCLHPCILMQFEEYRTCVCKYLINKYHKIVLSCVGRMDFIAVRGCAYVCLIFREQTLKKLKKREKYKLNGRMQKCIHVILNITYCKMFSIILPSLFMV